MHEGPAKNRLGLGRSKIGVRRVPADSPGDERGFTVNDKLEIPSNKISALSLFSGAGGLDIGAQLAGAKVISSLDFDRDSLLTLAANPYFAASEHRLSDIRDVTPKDYDGIIKSTKPEKLIIIGGPPCQPFSKAGYWVTHERRKSNDDPRNAIGDYFTLVSELKPDGFLLENVESILHPTNKIAVENFLANANRIGYEVLSVRANALDYGVPQRRKRVFFIGSRKPVQGEPIRTHGSDSERVLSKHLLPYEASKNWIERFGGPEFFEPEEITSGKTYSKELMLVPPGKNYIALTSNAGYPDPRFIAHKRFWSFLLKLDPEKPSWTIAAQPGPWVGPFHWTGRRLRVPEIAALQTFPLDYRFVGSRRSIQRQIGNAVPPLMAEAMIRHLISNI